MKKIKIYFIANEESLVSDEKQISNFIRDLNEKYDEQNLYFQLITDDSRDPFEEKDIQESDLFFILFSQEMDSITFDKFNLAYESFQQNKMPKISTYFKQSSNPANQSVLDFMKKLDEELGHYYSVYENIDTIKLNLILRLQTFGLNLGELENKEGRLYLDGRQLLSLDHIPMILHNTQLQDLKKEAETLEKEYWDSKEMFELNSDNITYEHRFKEVSEKREAVQNSIAGLEQNLLDLQFSFVKLSSEGNLSPRQIYAQKCLERGNIQSAKEALDLAQITEEAKQILNLRGGQKDSLQVKINELLQRVETLKLDNKNPNQFSEILHTFSEAMRIEKEGGLYRSSILKNAVFFLEENKAQEAISLADKFLSYFDLEELEEPFEDKFLAFQICGKAYSSLEDFEKAESFFKKALAIAEQKNSPTKIEDAYWDLLHFVYSSDSYQLQAEETGLKLVDFYKNILPSEKGLVSAYSALSSIYTDAEKWELAIQALLQVLEVCKNMDFAVTHNDILNCYTSLVHLYSIKHKFEKAFSFFQEKEKLVYILLKDFPDEYKTLDEEFQDDCEDFYLTISGSILNGSGRRVYKELLLSSLQVPSKKFMIFNAYFLYYYDSVKSEIQSSHKRKAKSLLKKMEKSIKKIESHLKEFSFFTNYPEETYSFLSRNYQRIAKLSLDLELLDKAKKYCLLAIQQENSKKVDNLSSRISKFNAYNDLLDVYSSEKPYDLPKIHEYSSILLEMLEENLKNYPEQFKIKAIFLYYFLGNLAHLEKQLEASENCYKKSLSFVEEVQTGRLSELYLFSVAKKLATLYHNLERYEEAISVREKVISAYEKILHKQTDMLMQPEKLRPLYQLQCDDYKLIGQDEKAKEFQEKVDNFERNWIKK